MTQLTHDLKKNHYILEVFFPSVVLLFFSFLFYSFLLFLSQPTQVHIIAVSTLHYINFLVLIPHFSEDSLRIGTMLCSSLVDRICHKTHVLYVEANRMSDGVCCMLRIAQSICAVLLEMEFQGSLCTVMLVSVLGVYSETLVLRC